MKLSLVDIGKRFKFHWIFRHVNIEVNARDVIAIKGPNGSGKSTLLRILSGFLSPSEGTVTFEVGNKIIQDFYNEVTYAAPYVDLIDQMTLKEHLNFHQNFKRFKNNLSVEEVIQKLQLEDAADKAIKDFSSGMKQRVRLGLAILSDSKLCILDEPTTNLDIHGFQWYESLLLEFRKNSGVVIASNEPRDFIQVNKTFNILDFKS